MRRSLSEASCNFVMLFIEHNGGQSTSFFAAIRLTNFVENRRRRTHDATMKSVFTGPVYVVRDNIDTDQIISAQYLALVPTIPDEYEKLGSYALAGLPESLYP